MPGFNPTRTTGPLTDQRLPVQADGARDPGARLARPRPQDVVPPPARLETAQSQRLVFAGVMATVIGTGLFAEFDDSSPAHKLGFALIVGGFASLARAITNTCLHGYTDRVP